MTENIRVNPREFDFPSKWQGLQINRVQNSGVRLYHVSCSSETHLKSELAINYDYSILLNTLSAVGWK